MTTITLELDSYELLPQVSTFLLVCELNRRIKNMSYINPELVDNLEELEDNLREAYAELFSAED